MGGVSSRGRKDATGIRLERCGPCGTIAVAAPPRHRRCPAEGSATPSHRPELSSMADDYARHALSQRAAFEATHPAALAAARRFADEPVLRVADLGAADGVNSYRLIRDLATERAGRPLIYALVDLPTNAWRVAAGHLETSSASGRTSARSSSSPGRATRPAGRRQRHGRPLPLAGGPRRGLPPSGRARPTARHGDQHGRHPPPAGALPAAGHRARRGDRDGDALDRRRGRPGLDRVGLPGLPGPRRRGRAARLARGRCAPVGAPAGNARHRTRAGRPVHRRDPGLPRSVPGQDRRLRRDRRGHEPAARRLVPRGAHRRRHRRRGRRSGVGAHARQAPGSLRRGRRARRRPGAESAELFRLDNPYWHDDPAAFARATCRA